MIDVGPLTQEDADEYRIYIGDDTIRGGAIRIIGEPVNDGRSTFAYEACLTMTNGDALELAAQLLIGAVYNASDSDFREQAWRGILKKRIEASRAT